ncbi:putative metallo-hydrolase YycJ [Rubripirellula amarantea]|uniref:Putative metallo-hydrolase YycJ n=1 Tax=Rubripirellula amarantea TaxID=2527999 RepID=A0A5C5WVW2_9BACT|nr:MBL fold metallo-hydrolase [Rubripirellula amarantea]TWT55094.1 putative metallo-hydrolase YycJ [Rubripirellula amarantea]
MEVISLQSGSSGNCIYVETKGVRLLFDAGISGRAAEMRLAEHGKDIRDCDALIISHDHRDHICGMGTFHRKFGLPVYVTRKTFDEARRRIKIGKLSDVRHFDAGDTLTFGNVQVESICTPHDAVDGVVFVVDDCHHRFGILTDLGHIFDGLPAVVSSLDALIIESNYCPELLEKGPYPEFLKARIRGPRGHLSNQDCAEVLRFAQTERLKWACLGHLSEQNNDPAVAIATHHQVLGATFPVHCADRKSASQVLSIS